MTGEQICHDGGGNTDEDCVHTDGGSARQLSWVPVVGGQHSRSFQPALRPLDHRHASTATAQLAFTRDKQRATHAERRKGIGAVRADAAGNAAAQAAARKKGGVGEYMAGGRVQSESETIAQRIQR